MIIEDVQITPVAIPAEGLKEEKSDIVCALIIEISTDCGLVGIGESPLLLEEERLMLKEHDRIVVANGSLEQALALGRAGGNDYL